MLLQVHGGGWTIGNKDQQGIPLMQHLAAKGWVCVAINYRLAPRDPFPAQIIDVKRAIAWIREQHRRVRRRPRLHRDHRRLGRRPPDRARRGDRRTTRRTSRASRTPTPASRSPCRTTASTTSPGSTGLRSAELMRDRFLAPRVVKQRWADAPEVFEAGTPLLRITKDAPDFFVLHGAHDSLVSVEQARLFVARLREVSGATVVYAELPGAQHAFDVFPSIRARTSSAPSTGTCTGTGTAGAASAPDRCGSRPARPARQEDLREHEEPAEQGLRRLPTRRAAPAACGRRCSRHGEDQTVK